MTITVGELFAGISGFGLGMHRAGMDVRWAVEIDRDCQRVLRRHWPAIQIESDVREVGRHNLAPVDVITYGSPCQDLSVAGKRRGLAGERSGLYFEAIRVIRELEPRLAIWENVPGALSSHGGRDFAAALAALVGCAVTVPSGGWGASGVVFGPLGQCAWRILDAQYFGVAQRRRRVFVVYDPRTERAGEILFESDSLRGDSPPRRTAGQGAAAGAEGGAGSGSVVPILEATARQGEAHGSHHGVGDPGDPMYTLQSSKQHGIFVPDVSGPLVASGRGTERVGESRGQDTVVAFGISENQRAEVLLSDVARSVTSGGGKPGQGYPAVLAFGLSDQPTPKYGHDVMPTIDAPSTGGSQLGVVYGTEAFDASHANGGGQVAVAFALRGRDEGSVPEPSGDMSPAIRGASGGSTHTHVATFQQSSQAGKGTIGYNPDATVAKPVKTQVDGQMIHHGMTVRRLTPRECQRLMSFPDDWLDLDPPLSDSAKYRMCGNAVVCNVSEWLGKRIVAALEGA